MPEQTSSAVMAPSAFLPIFSTEGVGVHIARCLYDPHRRLTAPPMALKAASRAYHHAFYAPFHQLQQAAENHSLATAMLSLCSQSDAQDSAEVLQQGWHQYYRGLQLGASSTQDDKMPQDPIAAFERDYGTFYQRTIAPALDHSAFPLQARCAVFPSPDTVRANIKALRDCWDDQEKRDAILAKDPKTLFLFIQLCHWCSSLMADMLAVQQVGHPDKLAALFSDYPTSRTMNLAYLTPRALFTLMRCGYGAYLMGYIGPNFLPLLRQFTEEMITHLPQAMKTGPKESLRFYFLDRFQLQDSNKVPASGLPYSKLLFKDDGDLRHAGREYNYRAHLEILLEQQNTLQSLLLSTPEGLFDAVSHSGYNTVYIIDTLIRNPNHPYFSKLHGNHLFNMLKGEVESRVQAFMGNPNLAFLINRLTGEQCVKILVGEHEAITQFLEYQDKQGQFSNILKLHDGTIDQDKLERKKRLFEYYYQKCPLSDRAGIRKDIVLDQLHHPKKVENIAEYIPWLCRTFSTEKVASYLIPMKALIQKQCIENPIRLAQVVKLLAADHFAFIQRLLTPAFFKGASPAISALRDAFNALPRDHSGRELLYQAVNPHLPQLIQSVDDFTSTMKLLRPAECDALYQAKKNEVADLIRSRQDLEAFIRCIPVGEYAQVLCTPPLQSKLSFFGKTSALAIHSIVAFSRRLPEDHQEAFLGAIRPHLYERIRTPQAERSTLLREMMLLLSEPEEICFFSGIHEDHDCFLKLSDFTTFLSTPNDTDARLCDTHSAQCDALYGALQAPMDAKIESIHDIFSLSLCLGEAGKATLYSNDKNQTKVFIDGWRKAYPQLKDQYVMLLCACFGYLGYQDDKTKYRPEVSRVTQWSICCIVFLFTFPIQLAPDYVVRGQMNWLSGRSGPLSYSCMKFFRSQRAIFTMDLDDRQGHQNEHRAPLRNSTVSF